MHAELIASLQRVEMVYLMSIVVKSVTKEVQTQMKRQMHVGKTVYLHTVETV
jgi:hypothetical protein